jgi:hypothetical protein
MQGQMLHGVGRNGLDVFQVRRRPADFLKERGDEGLGCRSEAKFRERLFKKYFKQLDESK